MGVGNVYKYVERKTSTDRSLRRVYAWVDMGIMRSVGDLGISMGKEGNVFSPCRTT